MGKNNSGNNSKDKTKYIIITAATVCILAVGMIIGIVIGKSGKSSERDNTKQENVGRTVENTDAAVNDTGDNNTVNTGDSANAQNGDIEPDIKGNSESKNNVTDADDGNDDNGKDDTAGPTGSDTDDDGGSDVDEEDSGSDSQGKGDADTDGDETPVDNRKDDTADTTVDDVDNTGDADDDGKKDADSKDDETGTDTGYDNTVDTTEDDTDNSGDKDNTGDPDKKDEKKTGSAGSYILTYSIDNSWQDASTNMFGIQFGITNDTEEAVSGWKLVMEIEGLASVGGWNGTFTTDKNKLTITDAGYNSDIYAGGTVVIGCNLGTKASDVKVKSAKLNGKNMTVNSGKVDQNDPGLKNENNGGNGGSGNDGDNDSDKQGQDLIEEIKENTKGKKGDDWLHTDGKNILDKNGKKVWITGLNWFGYNTGTNTFDGLWNSQLKPTVKAIADHGFNLIRVPISAELINQWAAGKYPKANYNNAYNTELNSMNSLEIFDYFLALAEENGIKVMPDIHSAETNASGHNVNLWYTDKVKANDYYHALEWMAARYKDNDTIIAFDLKNEPHGKPYEGDGAAIWNDSKKANNWKYVAETAAAKVLAKNPNVLIMVEGIEIYPKDIKKNGNFSSTNDKDYYFNWWGGNLRGVADYPVNLGKYQDKLVYSPHDYGPTVYEQPWFEGKYTYDSLMKDCWHDNWFYIYEKNIAPLLIGEWGGFMKEPNLTWMTYMRKLIKTYHLNHTFWCLNANSGDTGGLLLDDFTTWDTEKYKFVKEVLWQQDGKFVGLDHEVPLGKNGITLKEAKSVS